MFRSPSEPSPFSSTRCPYDTQARCGRPYCPFAHRAETVDVVEGTANDVLVLDSDHLSDGGRSSVGTEIRQENPTEHFSGCYMGYVSTTNPTTTTTNDGHPPMFPTSAAIPQPPQMQQQQQHQQNGQQHLFFPNFPSMHQHQQPISALPQFGPSTAVPAHYVQSCPFVPTYPSYPPQQQFSEPIMYSHPPVPLATVSTTMAPPFPSVAAAAVQPQTVAPSAVKQHRSSHKRPKTAAGPGGLPAYIPTPIAQLEKEQRERERRREERRVRKEDGQPKKEKEHGAEKQSDDGKAARQREQMEQQNDRGRRESVGEGVSVLGGGAGSSSRETVKEREAPTSAADNAAGGGLNIDRIMDDQKQLLNEMSDDREKKIREILRVEAEHERRRVHMAKQKTASKKFILSNKTTAGGGGPAKSPSKLTKMKKTIDKKKAAATLKKKKLLTTKNGAEGEKKEKHNTVIKALVDEKRKHQKQKEEKEQIEKKKKEKEEEERNKKKKQKQTAVNNCVKQVAELDKEIAKIQSELQRSSNKMANLHTGKMSTPAKKVPVTNSTPTVLQNTVVAHKTGEQKMKKIPVWRNSEQLSRPCTFLEDTRFYLATQRHPIPAALRRDGTAAKSVDSIVNDLFGDDIEEGTNLAGKAKVKKQRSASTAAAANEMPPVDNPKKLLHLATKREKQRHKSPKRVNAEHDDVGGADFDDLQRERQAMIDSIIEDENLENDHHQPMHQAKGNDGTAKSGEAKRKSPPPPPPQMAHSKKRRLSRSPSIVTLRSSSASSSVSVVPETPQASPSRDNYVPARDNYVPSRVPMHHPSQRPTAPKPFTAKSSSTSFSSVAVTTASRPSVSSSTSVVAAAATSASGSATHHQQHQPQKKQHQETQQHNANIAAKTKPATVAKGTVRKAHVPKFQSANPSTSTAKLLVPLEPLNRKVPLQLRQRHLTTIYAEYAKICGDDPSRAIEGAQNEEKSVLDRCNGKMGYLAAIPMLIKRLRDAAADGHNSHDEGETRRRDSVSHTSVLLGRHAKTVTCGLHRAERSSLTAQHTNFTEADFYNALQDGYLLTDQQMWDNGYPRWAETSAAGDEAMEEEEEGRQGLDTDDPNAGKRRVEIRQSELDAGKSRIPFVDDAVLSRVCDRCGKEYRLTKEGDYAAGASSDQCIFHWGRAWKKRVSGTVESRYNCCDQPLTVQGCDVAPHHITQTQRLSTLRCYAETPRPFGVGDPRSKKVYALDCEMVYTVWGPEVARLSVVDITGDLILDVIIRPEHRIVDCNTKFSGLKPEQVMAGECDLHEAHQRFFELVNTETILLGHSLESDLRAMHLVHRRVVDTSVVFPHRMGPPYKRALKTLAAELTQMIIQDDESGHDSKEDALACMRIMLRKCRGGAGAP
ncbi:hypothetical protein niasHT_039745 [Heterodera trifolii]|uniref:Exonuclease domain-containing protein n=1 Tax=Heterodera trifolii TaxID=157864 RepID=A0ABD2I375_9BILA